MLPTLRYLFLTARRDRLFLAMMAAFGLVALLGSFIGDQSVIEGREATAAFVAFSGRMVLVFGMVLFVATHIRRAFESREILMILSRPVSRHGFVLSCWASFSIIAILLLAVFGGLLYVVAHPPAMGLVLFMAGMLLETTLMIGVALFFSLGMESVVGVVFSSFGFYMLARMMGVLVAIANSEFRGVELPMALALDQVANLMSFIFPRLDQFGQSSWLVYGRGLDLSLAGMALQVGLYTALVLAAAIFDFRRKRF
ncbi:MAG TPA: hypothetical protein DCW68_03690 [Rhodospirillaceae bacterium]|nr:MAG: hypothetical protein A2018_07770 [Alphaproteobacteria bacterium GWF2_58_20]HAU29196.1 hypothetical protein [Rhodospirillaceae bacterium]